VFHSGTSSVIGCSAASRVPPSMEDARHPGAQRGRGDEQVWPAVVAQALEIH
jgi:hypothetical protein